MQLLHHYQMDPAPQAWFLPRHVEHLPQPRRAGAAGVALFGANYLFDGHVIGMFIFPSIIALIVGFIGLRYGSDSPESYGLGKAEELFGEEISEEDKETEENEMTKWQIFVEYVLKTK